MENRDSIAGSCSAFNLHRAGGCQAWPDRAGSALHACMQVVQRLSGDVPVFISAGEEPDDWEAPAEEVDDRFLGDAQIW